MPSPLRAELISKLESAKGGPIFWETYKKEQPPKLGLIEKGN
jgi:hypothetical protein